MKQEVRVRFAPSPTGYLHMGSIRTALFNWLFARHNHGKFLIRVEDTDQSRGVSKAKTESLDTLKKLKLDWDEEPVVQSERIGQYVKVAKRLLDDDQAYYDDSGVLKFRVPDEGKVVFVDILYGKTIFSLNDIEDFTILRSNDGFPLYNFACVVDDREMEITHVIRGNDHISNTPRQILLYKALGWKEPAFAHLPTVLGTDGQPLAKRRGALSLDVYLGRGFLPAAVSNCLALLGWSPGSNTEIVSLEELVDLFDLSKVSTHNAVFDPKKMEWINSQHLARTDDAKLVSMLKTYRIEIDKEPLLKLVGLYKSRSRLLNDFIERLKFFHSQTTYSERARDEILSREDAVPILKVVKNTLEPLCRFGMESIQESLRSIDKEEILELSFSMDELLSKEDAVPILEAVRGALVALDPFNQEKLEESLRSIDKKQVLELLYNVNSEFKHELDNGIIPESLCRKFENGGMKLSQEAAVLTKDSNKWRIKDGIKVYHIKIEEGKLYVYRLRFKDVVQAVRVAIVGDTVSPDIFEILALVGQDKVLDKIQKCINFCQTTQRGST